MINLWKRMSGEAFLEVQKVYRAGGESEPMKAKLHEILERNGVEAPEMLALFIAVVAKDIAWEEVKEGENKWFYLASKGHYVDSKTYKETLESMRGVA